MSNINDDFELKTDINLRKIVVVGGGAAGMFASYVAASLGKQVTLFEKNEKLGKKVYITGKGRCNLTNNVFCNEFFNNVVSNPKFLFSCVNSFSPQDLMSFFTDNGLQLKTERGNRVFPYSDKASDVTKTLEKVLNKYGVGINLGTEVTEILTENNSVVAIRLKTGERVDCDSVIVCTGGVSYPLTGSTGDGYRFAKNLGHEIVETEPGLVGIELKGAEFLQLQGLSLKNVKLTAYIDGKEIFSDFGEMMFTHFGISGPIVLTCSSKINRQKLEKIQIAIDLKPALDVDTLDKRLLREFKDNNTKTISNVMRSLLPKSLIDLVLVRSKIYSDKKCCEITSIERTSIISVLKNLVFECKKLRPIDEAIITAGGVSVKQINPKTMQSKIIDGLYFAGEVLDVDALTGGFNLQIAFSTAYAAGVNC